MFRFVTMVILVVLGWLAGDRYGAPDWAANAFGGVIGTVESKISGNATDLEDAAADDVSADAEGSQDTDQQDTQQHDIGQSADQDTDQGTGQNTGQNTGMRTNSAALAIIKESEGLRLEAYSAGGKSYIGYGHQLKAGEPRTITEAQAEALLRDDLRSFETAVASYLTREANINEFSAMVSLAYNIGPGRFKSHSKVLTYFNASEKQKAADAFLDHNRAGGQVVAHLTHRREKERALFLTPA